ncbi:Hemolysin activation-secretion protein [Halomicronema hongdechloris C2206]|uniref:Hemolysin activation-secretion protein n=1 Tax=Halomicronema hongdechloris C2206 TaxID=1641165 RepID=A0A1Z3HUV3_9CYAN|nr:ShlB/FhaC/HecB family hemolysin secretion/activation protein [Halomicronema hongdechloris]ASC74055.1 Hemolysin activation-secretion protein [Halomicronema hongdechloris C2206]
MVEADSFDVGYTLDNNRSPAVGSLRHQVELREGNVSGFGDRLTLGYTSTSGSKGFDLTYTLPVSPDNTTLAVDFTTTDSEVIEDPFDVLDITADSGALALTLRHPLIETPTREVALGLQLSRERTQTFLGIADIGGFPLSRGADEDGQTVVSSLGFFQEWTQRSLEQVLAVRSQFNLGFDMLGATINETGPDSRFFSWQGQAQWVRLLAPDTLLLLKGSVQLTPDSLLGLEQIGIGGQATVRGYRQDELLTDNGALASLEVRLPIYRNPEHDALLQVVVPFIDLGYGWNTEEANPDTNFIAGLGAGLLFQMEALRARLDIGLPLVDTNTEANSLQERGVYFTVDYAFF